MKKAMAAVTSLGYVTTGTVTIKGDNPAAMFKQLTLAINASGGFAGVLTDFASWQGKDILEIDTEIILPDMTLALDDFQWETRIVNEVIYSNFLNIPQIPMMPIDLAFIENQWIELDLAKLQDPMDIEPQEPEPTPEQLNEVMVKIKDIVINAEILKVTEVLPVTTIGEINVYHYKFEVDEKALGDLFIAFSEIEVEGMPAKKKPTEAEIKEMKTELAKVEMPTGELWICKETLLLKRISIDWGIEEKDEATGFTDSFLLSFDTVLKNHNQPFTVEAPENTIPLEEMMGIMMPEPEPMPMW
jgi:hypothetical protein